MRSRLLFPKFQYAFIFALFLISIDSSAQRFYSVVFDKLPVNKQLYAREDDNLATVDISGVIEIDGFSHMSAVVYKDGERYSYTKSKLTYSAGNPKTSFSMAAKINAELSEYTFEVYACRANDSTLIVRREKVLAGDYYIINGQSNAVATGKYITDTPEFVNKFSRSIGRVPTDTPALGTADTLWMNPAWMTPALGVWGAELLRLIVTNHQIPVAMLNGAIPGTYIEQHLSRDPNNPAKPDPIYGHLLWRTLISKTTKVRGFFWFQGEEDAWHDPGSYAGKFDQLMKYWQIDYPMVDRFIIVQINIVDGEHYEAGALREVLRTAKYKYPKTDHFASVGLFPTYDEVHYLPEGYTKLANQFYDFLGPKVYKATLDRNIDSPDIQKVFLSSAKNEINLVFDEKQDLKWISDTTVNGIKTRLQDQFFLDGDESKPASISSWDVQGRRIVLKLSQPISATKLNYLPSYKKGYYQGPYIRNIRGLGAFSFHEFPIATALEAIPLTANYLATNSVQLTWPKGSATQYLIERKKEGETSFVTLKTVENATSFDDSNVILGTTYQYRLRAISTTSESPYSEVTIAAEPILGYEPTINGLISKAYPNPASELINIEFKEPATGLLDLLSIGGQVMKSQKITNTKVASFTTNQLATGVYLLSYKGKNGTKSTLRFFKK